MKNDYVFDPMNRNCISKRQCKQLLENELFQKFDDDDDKELVALIESSRDYFDSEIVVFHYFISKLLEQYLKHDEAKCSAIIEFLKILPEKMFLTYEEFDNNFIEKLMKESFPSNDNSLEDDLIEIRNSYNA